jgi:hypothetical protein
MVGAARPIFSLEPGPGLRATVSGRRARYSEYRTHEHEDDRQRAA